jgi:hypothetical protein
LTKTAFISYRYSVTLGDPENILEYLLETRILCKIDDVAGKLNRQVLFHTIISHGTICFRYLRGRLFNYVYRIFSNNKNDTETLALLFNA